MVKDSFHRIHCINTTRWLLKMLLISIAFAVQPERPSLQVMHHTREGLLVYQRTLKAQCQGYVGVGGSLTWTLTTGSNSTRVSISAEGNVYGSFQVSEDLEVTYLIGTDERQGPVISSTLQVTVHSYLEGASLQCETSNSRSPNSSWTLTSERHDLHINGFGGIEKYNSRIEDSTTENHFKYSTPAILAGILALVTVVSACLTVAVASFTKQWSKRRKELKREASRFSGRKAIRPGRFSRDAPDYDVYGDTNGDDDYDVDEDDEDDEADDFNDSDESIRCDEEKYNTESELNSVTSANSAGSRASKAPGQAR